MTAPSSTSRVIRLAPADEAALAAVAAHESGHELVGDSYRLDPHSFIASTGAGICLHDRGTPAQVAATCWGGLLGEDLLDHRHPNRTLPDVPLSAATLGKWFNQVMSLDGKAQLSAEDRRGIEGFPALSACEAAFRILSDQIVVLKLMTELLVEQSRPQAHDALVRGSEVCDEMEIALWSHHVREEAVAAGQQANAAELLAKLDELSRMPPRFPADLEDFLTIIVAAREVVSPEHARRLVEFAAFRRARSGDPAFLETRFDTKEHWLFTLGEYRDWLARRQRA